MKKVVAIIVILLFVITCQPPRKMGRDIKTDRVYIDTIFDANGNVLSIKKHNEKVKHYEMYYYSLMAVSFIMLYLIIKKNN